MSVEKEPSGRRSVQTEFEVPGTPDEVWQAIATGPGVSSWMMPAEFEEQDGKPVALRLKFRPGIEPRSTVTTWDPPRALSLLGSGPAPGSPPIATEWHIQAMAGGGCTVRIVHSLFAATDDWNDQLEGVESGWSGFLRTLRVYLAHFRGQGAVLTKWMVPVAGTEAEAWRTFTTAVGLQGADVGQRWTAPAGVPAMGGVVEYVSVDPNDMLVRLDTPAPGIAAFGSVDMGGPRMVGMNVYFYGNAAEATAAREAPRWEAWSTANLPAPSEP